MAVISPVEPSTPVEGATYNVKRLTFLLECLQLLVWKTIKGSDLQRLPAINDHQIMPLLLIQEQQCLQRLHR